MTSRSAIIITLIIYAVVLICIIKLRSDEGSVFVTNGFALLFPACDLTLAIDFYKNAS